MEDRKMKFITTLLETIYDMVMNILTAAGVDVSNFPADILSR